MSKKTEKIKCCPFCGYDRIEICRTNQNACWLRCDFCDANSESAPGRETAIANWNRREEPDADFATIDFDGG